MYKVLFADDEVVMRLAFQKMMRDMPSEFVLSATVANGEEALSFISKNHVDIVITDLKMPVMDGVKLINQLNAQNFRGVIFALSNHTDFDLVRKALTGGATDYILKLDIDSETLLKQLNTAVALLKKEVNPDQVPYKKEVRDALSFISQNYTKKITLQDVAKAVNLNQSYLCRLFKKETGYHMFGHINKLKMEKATDLINEIIKTQDVYIREIASYVGIDDQFYFTRIFKKHHNIPPSEYIKIARDRLLAKPH